MNQSEYIRFLGYTDTVHFELNGVVWICEEWQGKRDHNGYGRFWWQGSWRQAHRQAYMWIDAEGKLREEPIEIPEDQPQLNHKCCNRACVNVNHLHPVTMKQNHEYRSMVYWARKERMEIKGGYPD